MGPEIDAARASEPESTDTTEQAYDHFGHGYGHGYGNRGGLDLDWHCRELAGPDARSVLLGRTAQDWFCRVHGDTFPIDMEEACRAQYRDDRIRAEYGDFHDPYSWACFVY